MYKVKYKLPNICLSSVDMSYLQNVFHLHTYSNEDYIFYHCTVWTVKHQKFLTMFVKKHGLSYNYAANML